MALISSLQKKVEGFGNLLVSVERKQVLHELIRYIQNKRDQNQPVKLNFICTHNSRRSQLSQIWAQAAAHHYGVKIQTFSGGVEVTEFNIRAVDAIARAGFTVTHEGDVNPKYSVVYSNTEQAMVCFSKVYDDAYNADSGFAAVMTCSHADENCPFIIGAESRIPVRYEDPKAFDDTDLETIKYDERSDQIAIEMLYVFSQIKA